MWFRAGYRPTARGIFRQFTHFGATTRGLRWPAAAVTTARGHAADFAGTVCPNRESQEKGTNKKLERQPKREAAKTLNRRSSHG